MLRKSCILTREMKLTTKLNDALFEHMNIAMDIVYCIPTVGNQPELKRIAKELPVLKFDCFHCICYL